MDDAVLLHRYAAEKSEKAFAELVRRHIDLVYSTALRQLAGDTHLAQDVAQTVFTDLARKAASLTDRTALTGWLYLGAHHAAAQVVRTEQRRRARETEATTMQQLISSDPTAATDWDRVRPVLDDAMRELTEPDREAVLLRFFEKRPFAEIGAALHLTEDAARMRVERALDKLHALLARRGVTSTSAALAVVLAEQAVAAAPAGFAASVTGGALASAGAMGAAATSIFQIMSTTKIITGVAVTLAILAFSCAVIEWNQARVERAEFVAMREQRDQLQRRAANLETQVREVSTRAASAQIPLPAAPVRAPESAAIPDAKANAQAQAVSSSLLRASNPLGSLYALHGNPEAMEAWLKAERSGLDLQLGPLFTTLGLSPEQTERFKDIMMEKFQTITDIMGAAQSQGLAIGSPAVKLNFKDATDKAENDLRTLLGPTGYEQMRQYGTTSEVRDVVRSLAGDVYHTDTPLSTQQSDRLVQLIASNSQQNSAGYRVDTTNWPNVFRDAPEFLSPAQLAMLRAETEQLRLRQQLDGPSKSTKPPGK